MFDKKSEAVVNIMYNHVLRMGKPDLTDVILTLFKEGDTLELGKTYLEESGWPCTMVKAVAPDRGEYEWGYRFFGNNGIWYRENGKTSVYDDQSGLNDIVCQ